MFGVSAPFESALQRAARLFRMMITAVPLTSFGATERVKTNLRSTMRDDRLSALAVRVIEEDLTESSHKNTEEADKELAKGTDRKVTFIVRRHLAFS